MTALRVAVVGTGHVGLVTCASMAAIGHTVVGMDSDEEKIAQLQAGGCPFFEPGLEELLAEQIAAGRLSFTRDIGEAVTDTDVAFICVGTPPRAGGEASLVAVERAGREIARGATNGMVVVEKSTVPAGTAGRLVHVLSHERPDLDPKLEVASNPEFLREGNAVRDSLEPDRILVGAESEWARRRMRALYEPLIDKGHKYIETDIATAELAKHACNAFLAMKISFANALAQMSERAGADVLDVAEVMGADPRIGPAFLNAGLGYGGYCFPKDLQAFGRLAGKLGYDFPLLSEIERINTEAVAGVFAKVQERLWNLEDKRVCLLGLSFKPGTDDIRFSPALSLAEMLIQAGAEVIGYDPEAMHAAKAEAPELQIASDAYDAAQGAHCLVLCTEWDEFKHLDFDRLKDEMTYPIVIDGRNTLDAETLLSLGFAYDGVGRGSLVQKTEGRDA